MNELFSLVLVSFRYYIRRLLQVLHRVRVLVSFRYYTFGYKKTGYGGFMEF